MNHLYSFASLGGIECGAFRLRGVGLANCLFPWARCAIASQRYSLTRIASTWPQLCHRQWLRWDRDKRCYIRLFDERDTTIHGRRKLALLTTRPRINETDYLANPAAYNSGVVVFSGIQGYFSAIQDEHEFVRKLLTHATRPRHKLFLDTSELPEIYVHVRYGDFVPPDGNAGPTLDFRHHQRQPISWFAHVVSQLRQRLGACVPARVFSDASDDELKSLLSLSGVTRCSFGSSIADLLALSNAKFLVASGSTFSMWAGYLGRMPVIWPQGQRRQALHGLRWEYEAEIGKESLPEEVVAVARRQLLA